MNKEYTGKFSIVRIFILVSLNFFNQIAICSDNYSDKNQKKYQSLYTKYNERYCQYLHTIKLHPISIQKKSNIYSSISNNNISEIQISNNFLNFKNIYLKNCNQLIFHQLGYQFTNKQKIYNFGLGYRNCYCHQWIIGNNIFYDTLLSHNNKKILSIGHELLKDSIHITMNTYHNISNNNFIYIQNKRFFPFYYDVYIKNRLPFFTNTYSKINIEHYFNHNKHSTYPQHANTMMNKCHHFHKNTYKLTFGLSYTPTTIFTFNVDKVIFSSIKNYETKFNIIANYKISIPWIYQKNYINNKKVDCSKIWSINNNEYAISRNHSVLFEYKNINCIEKKMSKNHTEHIKTTAQENELREASHSIYLSDENEHTTSDQKNILYSDKLQNLKDESLNNGTSLILQQSDTNLKLHSQIQTNLNNNIIDQSKNNHFININSNDELPSSSTNNNCKYQIITFATDINNSQVSFPEKTLESPNSQITPKELNNFNHINNFNIPPPPPMFSVSKTTNQNDSNPHANNSQIYFINHDNRLNDSKYDIENIKKHKKNKFSSLGSEEHLLKLNNVSQKRKKTISTSSNDSNDSESTRLLKIIERQSMLITNNDTDSDGKDSTISSDEFSE